MEKYSKEPINYVQLSRINDYIRMRWQRWALVIMPLCITPSADIVKSPVITWTNFGYRLFATLLHATGWKISYCVAAAVLMTEFRKVISLMYLVSIRRTVCYCCLSGRCFTLWKVRLLFSAKMQFYAGWFAIFTFWGLCASGNIF